MELDQVLKKRRSYRHFLKKPVSRDDIKKLIIAGREAPVSCNLQLTKYIIVDEVTLLNRLTKEVSYKFAYAPACIVVLNDPRFTVERKSGVMTTGMAVQNILLKATDLGLATCPMAGFDNDSTIKKILSIPNELDILLLIALGYPDETVKIQPANKIPLESVYEYNSFSPRLSFINESDKLEEHTPKSILDYRYRISSVYLDRYRLHTISNSEYIRSVEIFKKNVLSKIPKNSTVLDLVSYEGFFLKKLSSEVSSSIKIIATDYLESALNFFKDDLRTETIKINERNQLELKGSLFVNCITFIFGFNFTPKVDELLSNSVNTLEKGGIFYTVYFEYSLFRKIALFLKKYFLRLRGKRVNIYENNTFYKIGPYVSISKKEVEKKLNQFDLHKIEEGIISSDRKRGVNIYYSIFSLQAGKR